MTKLKKNEAGKPERIELIMAERLMLHSGVTDEGI